MQKKTVSLRTKQHIYESYITIHYQIILFFIKNINDYLNDGWLMKDVKRSANTMKTMKDGENRCASFHHSSFRGTNRKFNLSFYQLCYRSSSYQFQYPLQTPQVWTFYCDYHNILILYLHSCVNSVRGVCVHRKPETASCEPRFWIRKEWWHTRQI